LRAEKHPAQVDRHHLVPILKRHVQEGAFALDAGIVHQDVDRAKLPKHPGEHRFDLALLADVRVHRDGLAARGFDVGHNSLGGLPLGSVVDDNRCARRSQTPRHRFADARARARNEGAATGQRLNRRVHFAVPNCPDCVDFL